MENPWSLEGLSDLRLRSGVDMRPTLLRVLTDLYVQKLTHTADEERHYTELALRLLDAVDVTTRVAVAGRLGRHLSPPQRVIQRLAADLPDVAAPLRGHPLLQPTIAPRKAAVAATLGETMTVKDVAALDKQAPFAEVRVHDRPLDEAVPAAAEPVIGVDTASELNELFFAAKADERRLILLGLQIVAPMPAGSAKLVRDAAIARHLESAALSRNHEEFAHHLARALAIPRIQARRILSDELGEPIVTAAKALQLPRDVVYRLLLFVNNAVGHSVERVHALATLHDEMTLQTAEHMVTLWQALVRPERALQQHRPLLWNDEARARARTASATVRRAPSPQRPGERRDAS